MKRNAWSHGLSVTADGTGVVSLAGSGAVRLLADRVGLTDALSTALTRKGFVPGHDRGRVLVDVATVLAAGGEAIGDIKTLHHEPLWGPVASAATVWRTLDEVTPAALKRIAQARAKVRRHVWTQLPGGVPASPVAGTDLGEVVVIDIDATLVTAHSEKEQAAANFKGGFGFHPLGAWCDCENRGESFRSWSDSWCDWLDALVLICRPGPGWLLACRPSPPERVPIGAFAQRAPSQS